MSFLCVFYFLRLQEHCSSTNANVEEKTSCCCHVQMACKTDRQVLMHLPLRRLVHISQGLLNDYFHSLLSSLWECLTQPALSYLKSFVFQTREHLEERKPHLFLLAWVKIDSCQGSLMCLAKQYP